MPVFGEKPVTSITVKINQLTTPHRNDEIDDLIELYLLDLLHLINVQPNSGATEAARAIRKKIKYGESVNEQLRSLALLEMLVLNAGPSIGPVLASDDKLLDVLRGVVNGSGKTFLGAAYDIDVQKKAQEMAIGWKLELNDMDGYKYMASLWKAIPGKKARTHSRSASGRHSRTASASHDVFESLEDSPAIRVSSPNILKSPPPPRPTSQSPYTPRRTEKVLVKASKRRPDGSKRRRRRKGGVHYADEEYRIPQINYKVEAPKIRTVIADSLTYSTALTNTLTRLPSGVSPLDDEKALSEFDKCRSVRRKVLRYLQFVGAGDETAKSKDVVAMDEEFLGSLIHANEQLVEIFRRFDAAAGYGDANPAPNYDEEEDSDESYYTDESLDEEDVSARLQRATLGEGPSTLRKSPPPPRPAKPSALALAMQPKIVKTETNDTVESGSNPFGDGNEVSKSGSSYY